MEESEKPNGLTIEQLRTLKSYKNITQEQAQEIIGSIKMLVLLCYEHLHQKKNKIRQESLPQSEKNTFKSKKKTNSSKRKKK